MKYRITRPGLPAIMFGSGYDCWLLYRSALLRHSLEAAARQPGAELQRLREEVSSRGPEWLIGALAEIGRDRLRDMCKAAGLRVKSADGKNWLAVRELREALLAYLVPDAEKAGNFFDCKLYGQLAVISRF